MKTPHQTIVDVLEPGILGEHPGAADLVAREILEALAPMTASLELAYGMLWLTSVDRATKNGELVYQARQALLAVLDQDGKRRGVQAAMQAAAELETRKNARTDDGPRLIAMKDGTMRDDPRPMTERTCVFCEQPRLDGHLTCGRISCSESDARLERDRAWAARQARQLNAECDAELEQRRK